MKDQNAEKLQRIRKKDDSTLAKTQVEREAYSSKMIVFDKNKIKGHLCEVPT